MALDRKTTPRPDRLGPSRAPPRAIAEGAVNRPRDDGHTGRPGREGRKPSPAQAPLRSRGGRRRTLKGKQSPWKDRTSTRGNEGDVTDSSAE